MRSNGTSASRLVLPALLGGLLLSLLGPTGATARSSSQAIDPEVAAAVARHGSAKVMIVFRTRGPQRALAATVSNVWDVRARLLARAGDGFRAAARWDAVPAVPGWIDARGLERLAGDPDVRRIGLDGGAGRVADAESTPLIGADRAQALGYIGTGVTVGVLDSGIDEGHPDSAQDDNGHGTNVSGIIAGRGTIAPVGIAPGASLVMVKMINANGSFESADQIIDSLNWLALNRPDVKVINMSIVTFQTFSGDCDSSETWTMAISSAVATLRSHGVTLFASAGNDSSRTRMAAPACIRDVVSVGAVYDSAYGSNQAFCQDPSAADRVACFSDSSPTLDLLAPGALITSTGLRSTGSAISTYLGTSQASPHAAGSAAILLQQRPSLTPAQIEALLKGSGKPVTDWREGRVTPRIDVFAALNTPIVPHTLAVAKTGSGSVASNPPGIDCGATCSHVYDFGTPVKLTASAQKGWALAHWSGGCSGKGACTVLMAADHQVTAVFSRTCIVPNVKGKPLPAAKRAIRKARCKLGKIKRAFSKLRKGRVVSQQPAPRRIVPAGTAVRLTVSRGRK